MRQLIVYTVLLTAFAIPAMAQTTPTTSSKEPDVQAMLAEMEQTRKLLQDEPKEPILASESESLLQPLAGTTKKDTADILKALADQVDVLKTKVVVESATLKSTQSPRKVRILGNRTVYNYKPDAVYDITSAVDRVTDIQLKAGEALTNPPVAGDTVRWNLGVMKSGSGSSETTHLILKPLDEGIETNLIVTTDQHVYHIKARSDDWHMPAISWNYPQDMKAEMANAIKKEESIERNIKPDDLNFNYTISGDSYSWKPIRVFDDGQKSFIQMPHEMRVSDAPALFLLEDDSEPLLVNYRVKGDYYILDRIFDEAEMRVGTKRTVTIRSDRVRRNLFQRIFN